MPSSSSSENINLRDVVRTALAAAISARRDGAPINARGKGNAGKGKHPPYTEKILAITIGVVLALTLLLSLLAYKIAKAARRGPAASRRGDVETGGGGDFQRRRSKAAAAAAAAAMTMANMGPDSRAQRWSGASTIINGDRAAACTTAAHDALLPSSWSCTETDGCKGEELEGPSATVTSPAELPTVHPLMLPPVTRTRSTWTASSSVSVLERQSHHHRHHSNDDDDDGGGESYQDIPSPEPQDASSRRRRPSTPPAPQRVDSPAQATTAAQASQPRRISSLSEVVDRKGYLKPLDGEPPRREKNWRYYVRLSWAWKPQQAQGQGGSSAIMSRRPTGLLTSEEAATARETRHKSWASSSVAQLGNGK